MIVPIRNQPITFEPAQGEFAPCVTEDTYCQLARIEDEYCFQLRQTSCMPQILCNNDFSEFGTDVFFGTGNFDTMDEFQNWYADDDTWEWDEYGKRMCTIEPHAGSPAQYDFDAYTMSGDCSYVLTFTISGHDDESESVNDTLTVTLPDGTTQVVSLNGTYSFSTGTGASVIFTPGADWYGCIDDATLQCGGLCWEIENVNSVSLGGEGLCKTGAAVVTVTQSMPSLEVGDYYMIEVRVENMTAGEAEFFLGTQSIGTITDNGTYSLAGTANASAFNFTLDADFDGCVKYVNLYLLSNDYTLKLKDAYDDSLILDLTADLVYGKNVGGVIEKGDLIHGCIQFDEEHLGDFIPHFRQNAVCMYLEIESPADGDVVTDGDFLISNNNSILDNWSIDGVTYEAVRNQFIYTGGTGTLRQDLLGGGFVQGNTYYVAFEIKCLDHDSTPDFDSFTMSLGSASDGTGGTMVWDSTNFPTEVGLYVYKVIAGTDGNYLSFHFEDTNGLNRICLDHVSVRTTPCKKELLRSNCIKYGNENNGEKAWLGSKIFTACNEEGESMGFDWSTGFQLRSRLYATISNPEYQTAKEETYLYSNGVRKRIYAEIFKKFNLTIHEVDELTHDYIRTMLKCDQLFIDEGYDLDTQWVCLDNEYSPNWDSRAYKALVDAQTEIQRVDNSLFNTNCR